MTEAEWMEDAEDLTSGRFPLWVQAQPRKLRLLGCALCRRIWELIPHELNRQAVLSVEEHPEDVDREQYPGGVFSHPELNRALCASSSVEYECVGNPAYWAVKYLGRSYYKMPPGPAIAIVAARAQQARHEARADEAAAQAGLFRDIFANPPRRVSLARWMAPTVASLALAAYDERFLPSGHLDPARLAVLSDALEEAGCPETELLSHLRSAGPHVLGCWAMDLLLCVT